MIRDTQKLADEQRRASVEAFLEKKVTPFTRALSDLEATIDATAMPVRDSDTHHRIAELFQQSQDDCREFETAHQGDDELLLAAQDRFRTETDPWFSQSWIAQRARTKPSGFAGDFEMLLKLYAQATPARGIGGYLDLCISDLPLACAVRARKDSARAFLLHELGQRSGATRVLDIASGPCQEFLSWPRPKTGSSVEVVAMDNDPAALAYVEDNVATHLDAQTVLKPVRYNALRTRSAKATIKNFGRFDVIYSVGLCDYLSDTHLIGMLSAWRETLNDGGVLLIAFKDTLQYDKTPYQWHLDWFFFQRTLEDVLKLYSAAGFDTSKMTTERDATGIIINFIDRRAPKRILRTDVAEQVGRQPMSDNTLNQTPTQPDQT